MRFTKDVTEIFPMLKEVCEESPKPLDGSLLNKRIEDTLKSPAGVLITNDELNCFLWATLGHTMVTNEPVAFVSLIYVRPLYRKQGLGKQLIEKLKQYVEVYGVKTIIVVNTRPKLSSFASKLGQPDEQHFRISV
jgi:GNAT superfamily N-acetyltransferase